MLGFFVTFVTKWDKFWYGKWIGREDIKREWGNVESESLSISSFSLHFLILSPRHEEYTLSKSCQTDSQKLEINSRRIFKTNLNISWRTVVTFYWLMAGCFKCYFFLKQANRLFTQTQSDPQKLEINSKGTSATAWLPLAEIMCRATWSTVNGHGEDAKDNDDCVALMKIPKRMTIAMWKWKIRDCTIYRTSE